MAPLQLLLVAAAVCLAAQVSLEASRRPPALHSLAAAAAAAGPLVPTTACISLVLHSRPLRASAAMAKCLGDCSESPVVLAKNPVKDELIYVWTGDDDHLHPDFIAIFDFNRSSHTYGNLVKRVQLQGLSARGNEPHHLTFNTDYTRVAAAGILSFLYPFAATIPLQQQVFIFDTTNPRNPVQINTANPLLSGAADELYPVNETGGFLLSSLSTRAGTPIGRLTELDRNGNVKFEYPLLPPINPLNFASLNGFLGGIIGTIGSLFSNPINTANLLEPEGIISLGTLNIHGVAVREDLDIMVTTDFIEPASALNVTQAVYHGINYQPTFRLWKYSTRQIIDTWIVDPHSGNLVVHYIPHDPRGRFFGTGVHANKIYLLDPNLDKSNPGITWSVALDLTVAGYPNADPHYLILGDDRRTGFVTLNAADKVVYFDYSTPDNIKIVSVYSLPKGSNPHYLAFYPGGLGGTQSPYDNRFVLINYFLDFKNFGLIHRPGTKTVEVYQWNRTHIFKDPKWPVKNFKTLFPDTGVANPHGSTYYYNPY
eukprot:SM000287S10629  [mRNA]  locus=s287:95842:98670:- [translate_table: standard]